MLEVKVYLQLQKDLFLASDSRFVYVLNLSLAKLQTAFFPCGIGAGCLCLMDPRTEDTPCCGDSSYVAELKLERVCYQSQVFMACAPVLGLKLQVEPHSFGHAPA